MAYIGKQPSTKFSAAAKLDSFTGDGSTTTFDLTNVVPAGGENGLQVYVDNVRQKPGSANAYSLGNDGNGDLKRITFTAAPDSGAEIYVIITYEATNIKNVGDGTITSAKIVDGTIVNADINACAAISDTKLGTISTACKVATTAISQPGSSGVYLAGDGNWGAIDTSAIDTNAFNISLLGFKMAVNEGLTVFNLVDGVVDEFNDESGTDEAEGSNDVYCATSDFYQNLAFTPACVSAGFTTSSITEPDTSTAGTNPAIGSGTLGQFTVPTGMTSVNSYLWGAGGGGGGRPGDAPRLAGGGGGFTSGVISVSVGQVLKVTAGEGGDVYPVPDASLPLNNEGGYGIGNGGGDGIEGGGGGGGGAAGIATPSIGSPYSAPQLYMVAGAGGGSGYGNDCGSGGAGGGLTGDAAGTSAAEQTNARCGAGGGGDQEQGGQGGSGPSGASQAGSFLTGGNASAGDNSGGGGEGFYGGGGGSNSNPHTRGGGGGSSYYGNPNISCGATEEGSTGNPNAAGGLSSPFYVAGTNEGGIGGQSATQAGEDGYVLLTGSYCASTPGGSSTIVSTAFTSTSVPTTSRIVVFEENVDTPTLNTDIIASVSRDGGTTFTNATLSDSGYVTGSSGQRILTGQATISGQPSGQSMRWKLALANNTVKIHGVSLQWA